MLMDLSAVSWCTCPDHGHWVLFLEDREDYEAFIRSLRRMEE